MNLPIGSIILWTSTSIPAGWQICDGTNGTPNLINKFVKGASQDNDVGDSGGAASHVHTNTSVNAGGTHGHTGISVSTGNAETVKVYGYSSGTLRNSAEAHNHGSVSLTPNSYADHTHTVANTNAANNLPPYKQFIFIMRIL